MLYCKHCGSPLREGQHCLCPAAQAERSARGGSHAPEADQPVPPGQGGATPGPEAPGPHPGQGPSSGQAPNPGGGQGEGGEAPSWWSQTTATHSASGTPGSSPGQPSPATRIRTELLPFLKAYWHSPAQATRWAVERKDWLPAALLFAAQAVSAILAALSILLQFRRALASLLGMLMGGFGFLDGLELSAALSIPYGLVATVLGGALMGLMLFVLAKLFHFPVTFQAAFIACGVNTLPVTALLVLSFLLGLFSLGLGLGLLVMVLPVFAASGLVAARQLCPGQERGAFLAAYLVGVILVAACTYWLCAAILF